MKSSKAMNISNPRSRRGGALLTSLIAVVVLAGMTAAMLSMSVASNEEHRASSSRIDSLYIAEAGLSEAVAMLNANGVAGQVGSPTAPLAFSGNGTYWSTTVDNGDGTFTIQSIGQVESSARGVEAVMLSNDNTVFDNALFAGNTSGDPLYALDFGGSGNQADEITGDVYSGGDIDISGDASFYGDLRAAGTINGPGGEEGIGQGAPDIAGMDYENNNDFDVASAFAAATYESNAAGGSAYQLPEDDPNHIFRLNPSDRTSDTSATEKDDYFLEDPYEKVRTDPNMNGKDAYHITLSGSGGQPGPDGNEKVYYIDGNLWIHNKQTYSFKLYTNGDHTHVTFVVKGNIYFSDNLFYQNKEKDGVAFIAMKDDQVDDSGNIYFGDPVFGTLEHMDAFMYAENNFYDNNLDAQGSAEVTVVGNMSAGNQVLINRDYGNQHSKLTVEWDPRISDGTIALPGLPGMDAGADGYTMLSWREIPAN